MLYSPGNLASLNRVSFGGTLRTFTLAANTSYVLVASATSSTGLIHWAAETSTVPTGSAGWSSTLNSVYSSDSGSTWASYTVDTPVYSLQIADPLPPAPIPTLGEWGTMIMALMMLLVVGGRRMVGR
jgi:hypothetical protein